MRTCAETSRRRRRNSGRRVAVEGPWYKNAVVYCLAVETFFDGDGDGIGDFEGLIDRLEYFEWLGVDCLWLPPLFCSPSEDPGLHVAHFPAGGPRVGARRQ